MHHYETNMYEGMLAETTTVKSNKQDFINAYFARPLGSGPFPGIVMVHHAPGWDELYREFTRKFAHHGFLALSPNLYYRFGHGSAEDVAAKVRGAGGVSDDDVVADVLGSVDYMKSLPNCSGEIALFGTCSGGRHVFLVACRSKGLKAIVNCWGGRIVAGKEELSPKQPVAPLDLTKDLSCPMLGIFGDEDKNPSPQHVSTLEEELKKFGKSYEFHRYPGAGHGIFYYDRSAYRQEQAVDGWNKTFAFLEKHLKVPER
jgi:carboxymethylenebutenolidase